MHKILYHREIISRTGEQTVVKLFYTTLISVELAQYEIQSTLVISTSVISNNRLSRRKNLVLVIAQKSKIRL